MSLQIADCDYLSLRYAARWTAVAGVPSEARNKTSNVSLVGPLAARPRLSAPLNDSAVSSPINGHFEFLHFYLARGGELGPIFCPLLRPDRSAMFL